MEKLNLQQLAEIFVQNAQNYLRDELMNLGEESPVQIEQLKKITQQFIKDSPSEKVALAGMKYYATARIDRLLGEIVIRDYEMNRDRFLQAGLMEENNDFW